MGSKTKISIGFILLTICATSSYGSDALARERGDRRNGPPPEAYAACEGKVAGDAAQFKDPQGETVAGICELEGDRLVLRPDRPKRRSSNKHHGPPLDAYAVCEGKVAGDTAQFKDYHGVTVTGTCELESDRLVLRPTRPEKNSD